MTIEYRVRPVVKYQVTRYESDINGASCESLGEYPNEALAEKTRQALMESDRRYQESILGQGSPYAVVYYGFDEGLPLVEFESFYERALDNIREKSKIGQSYRIYKRI